MGKRITVARERAMIRRTLVLLSLGFRKLCKLLITEEPNRFNCFSEAVKTAGSAMIWASKTVGPRVAIQTAGAS